MLTEITARAYAVMPFVWCVGSIIGPAVGGALADPIRQYPEFFKPGGFLEEYPYALPNLFASAVLVIGVGVGILFLEETHVELKHKRDYGRELGKKLVALFSFRKTSPWYWSDSTDAEDRRKLLRPRSPEDEVAYATFRDETPPKTASKPPPLNRTFTPQIIHLIASYGLVALHTIAFEQLFPVFLSTPKAESPPSSWFKFVGGYGLPTREIGFILTVQGVLAMLIQFTIFPPLVARFGAYKVYRAIMTLYPIPYIIVPYLDFVPDKYQYAAIYGCLIIKILFGCLSYPCNMILLTNSAPSLLVLGTINGIAASIASLSRSFGPTLSGIIYSYGLNIGYVGLAWWINAGVCFIASVQAFWIKDPSSSDMDRLGNIDSFGEEAVEQVTVDAPVRATTAGASSAEECVNEYDIIQRVINHQN